MRYLLTVLFTLTFVACDDVAPNVPDSGTGMVELPLGGDGGVLAPGPGNYHLVRIDTVMTFPDAETACTNIGGDLAVLDTIAELEAAMVECFKDPTPPPYPGATCWTNTWVDNGTISQVFVTDEPGYWKPVAAASLDSWLFLPLCAVPN